MGQAALGVQLLAECTALLVTLNPVPGPAVETVPATAEPTGAASFPQGQVHPQELPNAEPYRTAPFHEEDQYGYEAYGSGY
ncbi:hypothetical protein [Streptomyces sp. NBC_00207]|nr:hypothetical protein [Streptomyces sp. DSM 41633]